MVTVDSMSSKATAPTKKKWTKAESAQFAEHLDERGFTIVAKEQLQRLNDFVQSVTSGLSMADPANAGREIAVVWRDHHQTLLDVTKVVLGLGSAQRQYDELKRGQAETEALTAAHDKMVKARSLLERMADELVARDREIRNVSREAAGSIEIDGEGNVSFEPAKGASVIDAASALN